MEHSDDTRSAFFERTDSQSKSGLFILFALLAFLGCTALSVTAIIKFGLVGLWVIPLPIGVLIIAGITLHRMSPGPTRGYETTADGVVWKNGESGRSLRFGEIRKIRRIIDSGGSPVFLRLYPETGEPMNIEYLEADRLAGLDRWISSMIPACVERLETREKASATFLHRHGSLIQILALIVLPNFICEVAGLHKGRGDVSFFILALLILTIGPGTPVKNRNTPDYEGALCVGATIRFLLSRGLAIACLCAYEAGIALF